MPARRASALDVGYGGGGGPGAAQGWGLFPAVREIAGSGEAGTWASVPFRWTGRQLGVPAWTRESSQLEVDLGSWAYRWYLKA